MYTNLRSDLVTQLCSLDRELACYVLSKFDLVSKNYDIRPKERTVAVYQDRNSQVMDLFLATMKLEGKSHKTIDRYKYIIGKMFDYIGLPYTDIQTNMIRSYLAFKTTSCSNTTVNGERAIISSYFNWLFNEGMISKNPIGSISKIKTQKKVKRAFTRTEIEKIRTGCKSKLTRAMIELMLASGCRVEEMIKIKLSDIDFDKGEVVILGKGNKERVLYFNEIAHHYIRQYVDDKKRKSSEYLFPNKSGEIRTTDSVRKLLKDIEQEIDVSDIHPHKFRTTFATEKYKSGMSIFDIAVLMGHENIATTQGYICADNSHIKNEYFARS